MEKAPYVSNKHHMFEVLRIPKERWLDTTLLCLNFSKYVNRGEVDFAMDYIHAFATGLQSTGKIPNWAIAIFKSLTASLGKTPTEAQEIINKVMYRSMRDKWLWQEADVQCILQGIPEEIQKEVGAFLRITLGYLENQDVEATLDFIDAFIFGTKSTWEAPAWALQLGATLRRKVREWESRIQQATDLSKEAMGRIMNLGKKPD